MNRFSDSVSHGVQADGKDDYSAVLDTDLHTASAVNMLGAAPLAPPLLRIRGDDQPFQVKALPLCQPGVFISQSADGGGSVAGGSVADDADAPRR